jgi:hypothetical protein
MASGQGDMALQPADAHLYSSFCGLAAAWDGADTVRIVRLMVSDVRKHLWGGLDLNQRPTDYESAALTN